MYYEEYLAKLTFFALIIELFCDWYFFKSWLFCVSILFFRQKLVKFITCHNWLFKMHFFFCVNMLLFHLTSAKFAISANNCQNMDFYCNWYFFKSAIILPKYTIVSLKPAKWVMFCDQFPNFRIDLHLVHSKIRKLSLMISSKKLLQTLKNCPVLQKISEFFGNGEFHFIKVISRKLTIFLSISSLWHLSPPSVI